MLTFDEPICYGKFLGRRKRFFMDVELASSEQVVAHTPNTGSMAGLLKPGCQVMLSRSADKKRSTAFTAHAMRIDETLVGINTHLPNKLIKNSLGHPLLSEFNIYNKVLREVRYGKDLRSRIDLLFDDGKHQSAHYVEIKNVTLKIGDQAQFPDSVSLRARKHIDDLLYIINQGFKASIIFLVQRTDCKSFAPAKTIDPVYAQALIAAHKQGLAIRAISAQIDESGLALQKELPCILTGES